MERAILSQSMKVIWVTLDVLEQEEAASLTGAGGGAPVHPGTGEKEGSGS